VLPARRAIYVQAADELRVLRCEGKEYPEGADVGEGKHADPAKFGRITIVRAQLSIVSRAWRLTERENRIATLVRTAGRLPEQPWPAMPAQRRLESSVRGFLCQENKVGLRVSAS